MADEKIIKVDLYIRIVDNNIEGYAVDADSLEDIELLTRLKEWMYGQTTSAMGGARSPIYVSDFIRFLKNLPVID